VDFSEESLREARSGMDRFYSTLKAVNEALTGQRTSETPPAETVLSEKDLQVLQRMEGLPERFREAMDDDFNTARAIGHLYEAVRVLNQYLAAAKRDDGAAHVLYRSREILRRTGTVLGIMKDDPDRYFEADRNREARKRGLDVEEIEGLVAARRLARERKDWQRADEIRQLLREKKIELKDSPDRTIWKIA